MISKIFKFILISFIISFFGFAISIRSIINLVGKMDYYLHKEDYQIKNVEFINLYQMKFGKSKNAFTDDSLLQYTPIQIKSDEWKYYNYQTENPPSRFNIVYNFNNKSAMYIGKIQKNVFSELIAQSLKDPFLGIFCVFFTVFVISIFSLYFIGFSSQGISFLYSEQMVLFNFLSFMISAFGFISIGYLIINMVNLRQDRYLNYNKYDPRVVLIDSFDVYDDNDVFKDEGIRQKNKNSTRTQIIYKGISGKCYSSELNNRKTEISIYRNNLLYYTSNEGFNKKMKIWYRPDTQKAFLANDDKLLNSYYEEVWERSPKGLTLLMFYSMFCFHLVRFNYIRMKEEKGKKQEVLI